MPNTLHGDPRTTAQLIAQALADPAGEEGYAALHCLRLRGGQEEFAAASALITQGGPAERELGAAILGQLGANPSTLLEESLPLLTMLLGDTAPGVVAAACYALGYRHDPRPLPQLLPLRHHPAAEVRLAVATALGSFTEQSTVQQALAELTRDSDEQVRDWATFGLGSLNEEDTPFIRATLWERVITEERESDAYGEAVVGLAERGDDRVLTAIQRELADGNPKVYFLLAAQALGATTLLPPLRQLWAVVHREGEDPNSHWLHELERTLTTLEAIAQRDSSGSSERPR